VFVSDPSKGGLVRFQANQVIPYAETKGYFCISAEDLELQFATQVIDVDEAKPQEK